MILYMIRGWVNRRTRRNLLVRTWEMKTVIVDNLERAKYEYQLALEMFKYKTQYANREGKVELFIPHIFEDGTLAYWPDNGYIEEYNL